LASKTPIAQLDVPKAMKRPSDEISRQVILPFSFKRLVFTGFQVTVSYLTMNVFLSALVFDFRDGLVMRTA